MGQHESCAPRPPTPNLRSRRGAFASYVDAHFCVPVLCFVYHYIRDCWAEAHIKITRMTLTIKLDRNWSSFQLANSTPPLSVTGSAIAPSARMLSHSRKSILHAYMLIAPRRARPTTRPTNRLSRRKSASKKHETCCLNKHPSL